MSGHKIIEGLEDAVRGDFSRVTMAGHVWIRDGVDKAAAWDAVQTARDNERERCAQLAETLSDEGRDGHQIAKVIRAGKRSPQEGAVPHD